MRWLVGFLFLCLGTGILVLGASALGAVHPLGDSLAMFRDWIAYGVAGLGAVLVLCRAWAGAAVAVACAGLALAHIASFGLANSPTNLPHMSVYSKNLGAGLADWPSLSEDIARRQADVVVLQELTPATVAALPNLLPNHPHQHICLFAGSRAIAVASRWPLSDGGCTAQRSLAHAVVASPQGPVWVASIHQVWPYPYDQARLLPDILAQVPPAAARHVVAGDFNMVPWGHSVRAIARAGGMQRIGPILTTIEVQGVGLPIDHVLTDGQGSVTRAERFGSDHYGLVARITWDMP